MSDDLDALLEPRVQAARRVAERVKRLQDVDLPRLDFWNYSPCRYHEQPDVECEYRLCGGPLFRHQRVGAAWLYLASKGLLADETGLGKTVQTLALIALLKHLRQPARTLVVCLPGAIEDPWLRDCRRFAPRLVVEPATGSRYQRLERYAGDGTCSWSASR